MCRGANGMWHLGSNQYFQLCRVYNYSVFSSIRPGPVRNLRTAIWFTSAIRRSAHRGFRAQIELSHPREVQLWRARSREIDSALTHATQTSSDELRRAHARYSDAAQP